MELKFQKRRMIDANHEEREEYARKHSGHSDYGGVATVKMKNLKIVKGINICESVVTILECIQNFLYFENQNIEKIGIALNVVISIVCSGLCFYICQKSKLLCENKEDKIPENYEWILRSMISFQLIIQIGMSHIHNDRFDMEMVSFYLKTTMIIEVLLGMFIIVRYQYKKHEK